MSFVLFFFYSLEIDYIPNFEIVEYIETKYLCCTFLLHKCKLLQKNCTYDTKWSYKDTCH